MRTYESIVLSTYPIIQLDGFLLFSVTEVGQSISIFAGQRGAVVWSVVFTITMIARLTVQLPT